MGSHIIAVKDNIKSLSDHLVKEYKGCDLKFAFVGYTDFDVNEATRTSWTNFTR